MPNLSLDQLKEKWFPTTHFFSDYGIDAPALPGHTDGNLLEPIINNRDFANRWYQLIKQTKYDHDSGTVFHRAWKINDFSEVGNFVDPVSGQSWNPVQIITENLPIIGAGLKIYLLISYHVMNRAFTKDDFLVNLPFLVVRNDHQHYWFGSNHIKTTVFRFSGSDAVALVGSADLFDWNMQQSIHEVAVEVRGPATFDLQKDFVNRWNFQTQFETPSPQIPIDPDNNPYPAVGSQSVQVLTTYEGDTTPTFSIWNSWQNAIKTAQHYIYIEDPYVQSFGWPAACDSHIDFRRESDIIFQLGEAIKRGVRVAILTRTGLVGSYVKDSGNFEVEEYQRYYSIEYLKNQNALPSTTGDFVAGELNVEFTDNETNSVHSKLLIADDQFAIVGSANIGARSFTYDGETSLGIVDEENDFARNLRVALFSKHIGPGFVSHPPVEDEEEEEGADATLLSYNRDFVDLKNAINSSAGNLKPFPVAAPRQPYLHRWKLDNLVAPYGGPPIVVENHFDGDSGDDEF